MKLLIIGGTRFVGPHLVTAALAQDAEVTLFNRGREESTVSGVEIIQGDRATELHKLSGRRWDAVIDTCGFLPRTVKAAAEFLSNAVDRYVFISSQSVYAEVSSPGVDETAPVKTLTAEQLDRANDIDTSGPSSAVSYGDLYGGLKALCEQAAEEAMPGRVLNLRPGLIVGPGDYTDRFTYWPVRVSRGGEVLAPGRPDRFVQLIDARDLATWTISMMQNKQSGTFNVNCRPSTITMQDVLRESKEISGSDATFTWVSEEFLFEKSVAAWSELPLWLPETDAPTLAGFMFVSTDKAIANGLATRPLAETIKDTFDWYGGDQLKAGLDAEKERQLLQDWHHR
jgi:2'-hydroxyisoflavone reductase